MHSIKEIGEELKGKRVFLRAGLNVPLEEGRVVDPYRLDKIIPTILFLKEHGARVIVAGHIGREPEETLRPVYEYINTKTPATFIEDIFDNTLPRTIEAMNDGDVIVLENLRRWPGEKANDAEFAKHLASFADIYVNDAFPVAHRAHASIVGVPAHIPGFMGLQFEDEIKHLSLALNPEHPFVFILGGAKFATKIPLMEKFIGIADTVFVGGALANDFFAHKGYEIGKSRTDEGDFDIAHIAESPKLMLPTDVLASFGETATIKNADALAASDTIVDAGPKTLETLTQRVGEAKLVLWNGPLGPYEIGFDKGTKTLLNILAESDATTIIGGGDTAALVSEMNIADKFTFVSTGGGAMLDFLADGKLPAIDALEASR